MNIIINADDFGWNKTISDAIMECFSTGMITTTTICANGEHVNYASRAVLNTEYRDKVGIHLNLTEGNPMTKEMRNCSTFCKNNLFGVPFSRTVPLSIKDKQIVYNELTEQVLFVKKLGIKIHHIDSHHHIHNAVNLFPIVLKVAEENNIKRIRSFRNTGDINIAKRIVKELYNRRIESSNMRYAKYFGSFEDYSKHNVCGSTSDKFEIMIHPDYSHDMILIDRDGEAPYDRPYGRELSYLIEEINKRGDRLI